MLEVASVHGRFQPFHNGHLEYVLAAKERSAFLWIGITKFDIDLSELTPLGSEREKPESNPLTYFERITIISRALQDSGVRSSEVRHIPFRIETPVELSQYLPTSVPCFTTIYDDWNRRKVRVLREAGYDVEV